jgi:tetratricopeptide (TPR) repeat protein
MALAGGINGGVSLEPCDRPGKVRCEFIGGIAGSELAEAGLQADYLTKRIALGQVESGIRGFRSYADLTAEAFGRNAPDSWNIDSRFWLVALYADLVSRENVCWLRSVALTVKVQNLAASFGGRAATNFVDAAAEGFSRQMSAGLEEVASRHLPLRQLQRAVGNIHLFTRLASRVPSERLAFWREECLVRTLAHSDYLDAIETPIPAGGRQVKVFGGVRLACRAFRTDVGLDPQAVRAAVVRHRPAPRSVCWPVPVLAGAAYEPRTIPPGELEGARRFLEGLQFMEQRDYPAAEAAFSAAQRLDPAAAEAGLMRIVAGRNAAARAGNLVRVESLRHELQAMADAASLLPDSAYELAVTERILGRDDRAAPILERILAERPGYLPALHALGAAFAKLGPREAAERCLNAYLAKITRRDRSWAEARRLLASLDGQGADWTPTSVGPAWTISIPPAWRVLTAERARALLPARGGLVWAAVHPSDNDCHCIVNTNAFPGRGMTRQQAEAWTPRIVGFHSRRSSGFRLLEAGPATLGGAQGVRIVFASTRAGGVELAQSIVTVAVDGTCITVTCTAPAAVFARMQEQVFARLQQSLTFSSP